MTVMVGVLLTVLAMGHIRTQPSVYWSRAEVVFLAPSSALYPNSLKTTSEDLIITAGVVSQRVSGTGVPPKVQSPEVTLPGLGEREAYSVRLPDTGGQWAHNYARQVLDVQVVGPTAAGVRTQQTQVVSRIDQELAALQDEAGVLEVNRITTELAPVTPNVRELRGEPRRALFMTTLLGIGGTTGLVIAGDADGRRRAARRRCAAGPVESPGVQPQK